MFEVKDTIKEAIIGYYSGDLTKDQADALIIWTQESPQNLSYFQEMAEIWNSTAGISAVQKDTAKALSSIRKKITDRDLRPIPSREIRLHLSTIYKIAAAVLLLVSLGIAGWFVKIPTAFSRICCLCGNFSSKRLKITDHLAGWNLYLAKRGY